MASYAEQDALRRANKAARRAAIAQGAAWVAAILIALGILVLAAPHGA